MADWLRHLEETLNVSLMYSLQTKSLQTMVTNTVKAILGDNLLYPPKRQAQKVSLTSYHLEGEANQWWQWIRRTFQEEGRALSWANFEDELWARFGPLECEDFDEALSRIWQDGSLHDYAGIQALGQLRTRLDVESSRGNIYGWLKNRHFEWQKCHGPRILMLEGYDGSDTILCDKDAEEQPNKKNYEETTEPKITLHVLIGWAAPKTMRIAARIGSHNIIVLTDNGLTHNFISERIANLLRLPVVPMKTFIVRVANGENLRC
ncbi:hypothetical protein Pint_16355 [Pistacia integerrima]|uniref:Uncharacterized protein n=1 Tax=Pistacia integerrima TaxID=434235 RepID=A0ACC0Z9V3_9ROSI|nr:hypothetical protein Pint_16355 [Pistacia integerrima]